MKIAVKLNLRDMVLYIINLASGANKMVYKKSIVKFISIILPRFITTQLFLFMT